MSLDFDSARLHNPHLTADHESWRTQLRKFLDREVAPFLDEWDENAKLPDELWLKAAEIGLLQIGYPEAYGGIPDGIDQRYVNITGEELGRIGSSG